MYICKVTIIIGQYNTIILTSIYILTKDIRLHPSRNKFQVSGIIVGIADISAHFTKLSHRLSQENYDTGYSDKSLLGLLLY